MPSSFSHLSLAILQSARINFSGALGCHAGLIGVFLSQSEEDMQCSGLAGLQRSGLKVRTAGKSGRVTVPSIDCVAAPRKAAGSSAGAASSLER